MNTMFIDAETDGLYGKIISVAAVVVDENGNEIKSYYHVVNYTLDDIESEWVKKNVYSILKTDSIDGCVMEKDEGGILQSFWEFYQENSDANIITDVTYPVEANLFIRMVNMDFNERMYKAPYPLMDLSSMLYAIGIDPLVTRTDLIEEKNFVQHNAMDDVRTSIEIWKKYFKEK